MEEATAVTKLTAFLHGYPPQWSMGGEVSTHRTLRVVPGSTVFTDCESPYSIDGVSVYPIHGFDLQSLKIAVTRSNPDVLFGHSASSLRCAHQYPCTRKNQLWRLFRLRGDFVNCFPNYSRP